MKNVSPPVVMGFNASPISALQVLGCAGFAKILWESGNALVGSAVATSAVMVDSPLCISCTCSCECGASYLLLFDADGMTLEGSKLQKPEGECSSV